MLVTIIAVIAIFGLLVLAHEWGHFMAARKLGVKVTEFGFGYPPRLYAFKRRGIEWSINWLPLGGFVRIKGETGEEREQPDSFAYQPAWRRAVILCAGVFMNIVLAFVLLTAGLMIGLPTALEGDQISQARDVQVQIVTVEPASAALKAGLQAGDVIKFLAGQPITAVEQVQKYVSEHPGQSIDLVYSRGQNQVTVNITPLVLSDKSEKPVLGVSLLQTGIISYPWYQAVGRGAEATYFLTVGILKGFGSLLHDLVFSRRVPTDVAGPVGIAVLTGQVVGLGWIYVLQFAALLSINLAILNILPFPALDGGRLLFVIIEKIRRRPNNQKVEAVVHNIGFALLMLLIVAVTYRDLIKFGGGIIKALGNF